MQIDSALGLSLSDFSKTAADYLTWIAFTQSAAFNAFSIHARPQLRIGAVILWSAPVTNQVLGRKGRVSETKTNPQLLDLLQFLDLSTLGGEIPRAIEAIIAANS